LEWWLVPRLPRDTIRRWPGTTVVEVVDGATPDELTVRLSNGERLVVNRLIYATGYRTRLQNVPYMRSMIERIETVDGFPALDASFQSTCPGLYITGFAATRDFGPFFGFTKGCPTAAAIIVDHLG
jgi:hypothetical protein